MDNTLTLTVEQAENIVCELDDNWECIESWITENDRWSIQKKGVFKKKDDETYWSVPWSIGATEYQDVDMFYEKEVTFQRVEKKEVLVEKWVSI